MQLLVKEASKRLYPTRDVFICSITQNMLKANSFLSHRYLTCEDIIRLDTIFYRLGWIRTYRWWLDNGNYATYIKRK